VPVSPMRVIGSYLSPYVRKVLACLDLKGLAYEIDPIVPFYGDERFTQLSPLRRVPVLVDDRATLADLIARAGLTPRQAMRTKGALWRELGLDDPAVCGDAILDAMAANPALIERPIVVTDKGVRLCRPPERLADFAGRRSRGSCSTLACCSAH